MMSIRTYMFIPATQRRFIELAIQGQRYDPDFFVFDFEDAIRDVFDADNEGSLKICARATLASFLPLPAALQPKYLLRINGVDEPPFAADLEFLEQTREHLPWAIVLPKVRSAEDIQRCVAALAAIDEGGPQPIDVIPLIESPEGVAHLSDILRASDRIQAFCFGHIDYFFELNRFPIPFSVVESAELAGLVRQMVTTAQSLRIPYIDSGFYYHHHIERLATHCAYVAYLAQGQVPLGKLVMHPDQIAQLRGLDWTPPPHDPLAGHVFPPPPTDAERRTFAQRIITTYESRPDRSKSVCRLDDLIIPPQLYLLAKRILL